MVSYLFWGGLTTLVGWLTFSLLSWLTGRVILSNLLSWLCAVAFAFVTNKQWVFGSTDWRAQTVWREAGKFLSARLITGVLEWVGVPVLAAWGEPLVGIEGLGAKMSVTVVVILLNYIFSKLLIFKK
jgi:putative flippase GtrA